MKQNLSIEELALCSEYLRDNSIEIPDYLLQYMQICDECAEESINLSFILDEVETELNKNKKKKLFKLSMFSVAASIILLLSIFFFLSDNFLKKDTVFFSKEYIDLEYKKYNNIKIPHKEIGEAAVNETITNEDNLLSTYIPDIETEKLVKRFEGDLRSSDIKVLTPALLEIKKSKFVVFNWENPKNYELQIEIYDNKLELIEQALINDTTYSVSKQLTYGLYYWKLFDEDFDLIFCGKIIK